MENKNKVIVIGIDGGDLKVINPLIEKGKLPNIKRIIEQGSLGILESSILPSSEQAWCSFSTGCNNGKYGIYSYIQRRSKDYKLELVDGSFFRGKRFWDILGEHNKKSIIINLITTYPVKEINGILVSGRCTPSNKVDYTYPKHIKEEIEKIAGHDYITRVPRVQWSKEAVKKRMDYINKVDKKTEERGNVARYLMKNYDWDLFVLVFDYTDSVQHIFWADFFQEDSPYNYVLPKIYERIDNEIGKLLSEIKEDVTVILMSDHGFADLKKRINFNSWLKQNGYMIQKRECINRLKRILIKRLYKLIPRKAEKKIREWFIGNTLSSMAYSDIDWENTKAFTVGSGGICINLEGRELRGSVKKEEYHELRNELISKLKGLKDPDTGKPVIKKTYKREDVYHGEYLGEAPDIVNLLEDGYKPDLLRTKDDVFTDEYLPTGNHSLYGFFAIQGSNIKKSKYNKNFKIIDLAPTILYLMGVSVPNYMDGKVMKTVLKKTNKILKVK